MRRSLATLAPALLLAAAVTLPAAGTMTVGAGSAQAQSYQHERGVTPRPLRPNPGVHQSLGRRPCHMPRLWLRGKAQRYLAHRGFRFVRYQGFRQGRCRQNLQFLVCFGYRRYGAFVRFSYGRYRGMNLVNAGPCQAHRGYRRPRG